MRNIKHTKLLLQQDSYSWSHASARTVYCCNMPLDLGYVERKLELVHGWHLELETLFCLHPAAALQYSTVHVKTLQAHQG